MKRHLLIICLCLLLGLATTTLIAWGLALRQPIDAKPRYHVRRPPDPAYFENRPETRWVVITSRRGHGYEYFRTLLAARSGRNDASLSFPTPDHGPELAAIVSPWARTVAAPWGSGKPWPHTRSLQVIIGYGWPRPALWSMHTPSRGGIRLDRTVADTRSERGTLPVALPCLPIWSGLLLDTGFFGTAWWVALLLPRLAVHAHRRRRGLCPACAYPVGSGEVCSECGRPRCGSGSPA